MSSEIYLGVIMFTVIVLALVILILIAKTKLVTSSDVKIEINGNPDLTLNVAAGNKLLNILAGQKIFLSSACGGGGTCGQCKVQVLDGGGEILPTELGHISKKEARSGMRLGCQVSVKNDLKLGIPDEVFNIKRWKCKVKSNNSVATFIKELVLELPPGEELHFRAGGYIQIEAPPHVIEYKDFIIPEKFRDDWDKFNMWKYKSVVSEDVIRAYSMASYPVEKNIIMLNVRIATPPPNKPDVSPGQMSSFIFGLKPGDEVYVSGAYGEFFAREGDREMCFIGGGAGMAPMRSHIFDQLLRLNSKRKISYWYGARSLKEMFYVAEFNELQKKYSNFTWHVALDNPLPEDKWSGHKGYIHQVLHESYLMNHEAPEDIEYYLCGPPMMASSVVNMLLGLGVDRENIMFDDFGA